MTFPIPGRHSSYFRATRMALDLGPARKRPWPCKGGSSPSFVQQPILPPAARRKFQSGGLPGEQIVQPAENESAGRAVKQRIARANQSVSKAAGSMKAGIDGADTGEKARTVGRDSEVNQPYARNGSSPNQSATDDQSFQRKTHDASFPGLLPRRAWSVLLPKMRDQAAAPWTEHLVSSEFDPIVHKEPGERVDPNEQRPKPANRVCFRHTSHPGAPDASSPTASRSGGRAAPSSDVRCQPVGRRGSPGARRVFNQRGLLVDHFRHHRPCRFYRVLANKKHPVAVHRVGEQPFVVIESYAPVIADGGQFHGHGDHFRAGTLDPRAEGEREIGAQPEAEIIAARNSSPQGRLLQRHQDFRGRDGQALAR